MSPTLFQRRGLELASLSLVLVFAPIDSGLSQRDSKNATRVVRDGAFDAPQVCKPAPCGFKVLYRKTGDSAFVLWRTLVMKSRLLEDAADYLNGTFLLPRDIPIKFTPCGGVANAFYSGATHDITICYELLNAFAEAFARVDSQLPDSIRGQDVGRGVRSSTFFTVYHETAHALIHELDLKMIVGNEEVAADQLATLLLLEDGEQGAEQAFTSAVGFMISGVGDTSTARLTYWDVHPFNQQRFYDITCLIYGSDHNAHLDLIEHHALPSDRAAGCEAEYQQIRRGWGTALAPHLRRGYP